jgi:hypothetical protein
LLFSPALKYYLLQVYIMIRHSKFQSSNTARFVSVLQFQGLLFEFSKQALFTGVGCQPASQPLTWRTRVPLLAWAITFDLSGKGDPTRSELPPA